jgi:hypothetical protein
MIPEDGINEEELEAEFLALVGGQPQALEKLKGQGKKDAQHILWDFCCGQYLELGTGMDMGQENRSPTFLESRFWVILSGSAVGGTGSFPICFLPCFSSLLRIWCVCV